MTFREFWPLYLQAHSKPATRAAHYGATLLGLGSAIVTLMTFELVFMLGIPLAYALAIGTHRFVEKNHSLIRVNPFWGAVADLRMSWLALSGGLRRELDKHGLQSPTHGALDWHKRAAE